MLLAADAVTTETLETLPKDVRDHLRTVAILLENHPCQDDVASGIEPDTLGYFDEDDTGLVRIRLWLDNILDYSGGDQSVFREEVRTTLLHEIGHVLGWDEDDVEERGLG